MKNKLFLSLGILCLLSIIFSIGFVSAGLCKGSDGYYHDCDGFSDRYYRSNFYPNYKTEYYLETSSSSTSILSIKESRNSYEKISASSYAESSIEYYKKERDYSYPKVSYDRYGRRVFFNDYNYSRFRDRRDYDGDKHYDKDYDYSYWRYKEPYYSEDYYNPDYNNYYYTPRYSESKGYFNWGW